MSFDKFGRYLDPFYITSGGKHSTPSLYKVQLQFPLTSKGDVNFTNKRLTNINLPRSLHDADANENSIKFMLTVIDTYSKYAWEIPVATKSATDVFTGMKTIFSSGRVPRNLQTVDGKEFFNKDFKKLMSDFQINHYSTFSHLKASIVERWNRTLKSKMWKEFSSGGSYKWIDILNNLVEEYNNSKHRTIQMKPSAVKKDTHIPAYHNKRHHQLKPSLFQVGDHVRISKHKHVFEKGYIPNWTTEVFRIAEVKHTIPVTFTIQDLDGNRIKGGFYQEELQKTKYPNTYLVEKFYKNEEINTLSSG